VRSRKAVTVGPDTLDRLRLALRRNGTAPNQIRHVIGTVKVVFNWVEYPELIAQNRVGRYRVPKAKDVEILKPAEYRTEDFRAMHAQLDP
jgi:hypothetical protein